jgi:hypothetical protein
MSTVGGPRLSTIPKFSNTYSLEFDGVNDYLDLGTESTVANGGQFTLSFWIKSAPATGSNLNNILFTSEPYYNLNRFWVMSGANIQWVNINNVTSNISVGVLDNTWHHVMIIWNPDGANSTIRCFTDGANEVNVATDWRYGNGGIYQGPINFIGGKGGKGVIGNIDEFAVWNDDQSDNVSTIYNGGVPNDLTDLSPNYWLRNGDNGSWKSPQWLLPSNENKDKVSNYSFDFDGVDDYIELGSLSNLQNATEYSISSWFKSPLNKIQNVIYSWSDGADGYLQLLLVDDGSFYVSNYRTSIAYGQSASGVVSADTWYNATVVFNGSGATNSDRLKLYINGSLITLTYTGTIPTQTGTMLSKTMWLGASNSFNFWGFEGNIDEVSIFDSAISIGDVWDGSGEPIDVSTVSGLKQYYKMGEEANFTSNWLVDNSALDNYSKRSFEFDGIDDYINCGDSDDFSFGNGVTDSPFSISAWINMDDATKFRVANKYISTSREYIFTTNSTDKLSFVLYDDSNGSRIQRKYNTALTSYQGQWINVVATYDGSSSSSGIKIYLNATRVDDIDANSGSYVAMENTTQPLEIGRSNLTSFSNGKIDEVSVFNSELSQSDITEIYNSGEPTTLPSGAIAHYRMGEDASFNGTNWTVPDQIGSNNGTSNAMDVDDLVGEAPNYSGGGISSGMDIEARVGEAPNSENNALSYNMEREDRVEETP